MKLRHMVLVFSFLFASLSSNAQINWATATGLALGATFVDGAEYTNFAGTGLNVRINVTIVNGYPSIESSDGTIARISSANGASMTVTILNGSADVSLSNYQNLLATEKIIVSNPNGKAITITETANNGGAAMTVDGVEMPSGAAPNAIIGDDSVIVREQNAGAGTFWTATMSAVNAFTWDYDAPGSTEGFRLSLTNIALPVELVSFDASLLANNEVQLSWETASELNNDYFTIECSNDAFSWEEKSRVRGAGTSLATNNYKYVDMNPLQGTSYYRLKQVDFDGTVSYSKNKSVQIDVLAEPVIFPNPTSNSIVISNLGLIDNNTLDKLLVTDAMGKNITEMVSILGLSETSIQVDLSSLPTGVYFIKTGNSTSTIYKN